MTVTHSTIVSQVNKWRGCVASSLFTWAIELVNVFSACLLIQSSVWFGKIEVNWLNQWNMIQYESFLQLLRHTLTLLLLHSSTLPPLLPVWIYVTMVEVLVCWWLKDHAVVYHVAGWYMKLNFSQQQFKWEVANSKRVCLTYAYSTSSPRWHWGDHMCTTSVARR